MYGENKYRVVHIEKLTLFSKYSRPGKVSMP